MGVFVDDLVITGTDSSCIKKFKAQMAQVFKMSDLGLLSYYLGIEVKRSKVGLHYLRGIMLGRFWRREVCWTVILVWFQWIPS